LKLVILICKSVNGMYWPPETLRMQSFLMEKPYALVLGCQEVLLIF